MTIQANGIGTKLRHGKADPENLLKTCANNLFPRLGGKKLSKMCEKVDMNGLSNRSKLTFQQIGQGLKENIS